MGFYSLENFSVFSLLGIFRFLGYKGKPRIYGLDIPLSLAGSRAQISRLDSGMYESKEVALIRRHLPTKVEILELGASIGIVSCVVLGLSPRRLVSYEAAPEMVNRARQIVAHNYDQPPWEIVNAAVVAQQSETTEFHWHPDSTDKGALY